MIGWYIRWVTVEIPGNAAYPGNSQYRPSGRKHGRRQDPAHAGGEEEDRRGRLERLIAKGGTTKKWPRQIVSASKWGLTDSLQITEIRIHIARRSPSPSTPPPCRRVLP